jgi:acetyl-CoA synthetase
MEQASTDFKIPETNPEDAALLHFTSGTTGMPKAFYMCIMLFYPHATGKYVLDFHEGDRFGVLIRVG